MADNVSITAGAGTTVATDQVGTDHYQRVKIADGTADSGTMVNIGNGVAANALRVTLASDGTGVVEQQSRSTATITTLTSATTSAQLLASTAGRKGLYLTNTDENPVYVKYGTTASSTNFTVKIPSNGYWEMPYPIYTGRIDAIWTADGSGSLISTEIT